MNFYKGQPHQKVLIFSEFFQRYISEKPVVEIYDFKTLFAFFQYVHYFCQSRERLFNKIILDLGVNAYHFGHHYPFETVQAYRQQRMRRHFKNKSFSQKKERVIEVSLEYLIREMFSEVNSGLFRIIITIILSIGNIIRKLKDDLNQFQHRFSND